MSRYGGVENSANSGSMPPVEIKDARSHGVRRLCKIPHYSANLAVMHKERDIRHLADTRGRTNKGERHLPVRSCRMLPREEFDLVGFCRILMPLSCSEHRKTAIDALRAMPAMRMKRRHVVDAGAAPRVPDQIAAHVCRYPIDNFRLRHPNERILH